MSEGFSVDLPCGQGDRVEIEGSAITVEDQNELGDEVRNTGETTSVDQRSEDRPNTTETTMQALGENSAVDPPVIPGYIQDLFASLIASMKAGNAELARSVEQKIKESNKELQSSVEQRIKESNDQMREEIRRDNEKLVEQFRLENQKLSKEFSGKLQAETSKLSRQVRQLQSDMEKELTWCRRSFRGSVRSSMPGWNSNSEATTR
jgi:DNA anti-recombination protein RmuC